MASGAAPDAPAGRLVVFEGAEGVGKSTQVARFVARCAAAGVAAASYREPGATPLGERVRAILLDEPGPIEPPAEALLFMAARAQLLARVRADLAAGTLVVLDRFFLSTYAYQVAGRGLDEAGVRAANALATGGLVPGLTLLLTCAPAVTATRLAARGAPDRLEREGAGFHARVAAAFAGALDRAWQVAHPEVGPVVRVDADGAPDVVAGRVLDAVVGRWPDLGDLRTFDGPSVGAPSDGALDETFRAAGESH